MDFLTYCTELLRLNQTRLSSFKDNRYFASVVIGMGEEMLELFCKTEASADNATDLILELGDILAYCLLTTAALRRDSVVGHVALAKDINAIWENLKTDHGDYDLSLHTTFVEIPLLAMGRAKRWFRESSLVNILDVYDYYNASHTFLNDFLQSKMQLAPVTLEYVAQQNIQKLLGRTERQSLFVGNGDDR